MPSPTPIHPALDLDTRAKRLFETLAPLTPEQRAPLIAHAQSTDPEALAEALDLLRYHDRDAHLIDSGLANAAANLDPAFAPPPPTIHHNDAIRPGVIIDNHLIRRPIGVGPVGTVYEALPLGTLSLREGALPSNHTPIALKLLRPGACDIEHASALSALLTSNPLPRHDHLCPTSTIRVIEIDAVPRVMISSDLRPGLSIVAHCRTMTLPTSQRLSLFAQAFAALGVLHASGRAHARLTLGNVVVTADNTCIIHDAALASVLASASLHHPALLDAQRTDTLALISLLIESLLGRAPTAPRDPLDAQTRKELKAIDRRLGRLDASASASAIATDLLAIVHDAEPATSLFGRIVRRMKR